jgi:nucleotide-binding universal stress UspA family protein
MAMASNNQGRSRIMKTMLVPVDFSEVTKAVLRAAADWAQVGGYRIHLLHVVPEQGDLIGYETGMQLLPRVALSESPEDAQFMQDCKEELTRHGLEVTTRIMQGSPVVEILDEATAMHADVIVVGSHRHGMLHDLFLGSVSRGVLRRATCPVLVVPTPETVEQRESEYKTGESEYTPAGAEPILPL